MTTKEKILKILFELSGIETIEEENELQSNLGLDSLNMVMLLMAIEDEFGIELDESDMNPFDLITVEDVIKLTEKYRRD